MLKKKEKDKKEKNMDVKKKIGKKIVEEKGWRKEDRKRRWEGE
jgi:hypothetical protein